MAKVLVSIEDQLLQRIDGAARRAGLSRSAYLARLAARELEAERGPGASAQVGKALEELDELFSRWPNREDPTTVIRAQRDAR